MKNFWRNIIILILFSLNISLYALMIIGHRGTAGSCIENTLSSFSQAIDDNVDAIELDIWKCASGELVVFHDSKVDRLTDGKGYIEHKTLSEIKELMVCGKEKIPTLSEVLDVVNHRTTIFIELKGMNLAYDVVKIIEQYVNDVQWSYDNFLVISFNHPQLKQIKVLNNKIKTGALLCAIPILLGQSVIDADADVAILYSECIDESIITDIHARGLLVYVYTVNDPDDFCKMIQYGVDGIITDYPKKLRQIVSDCRASKVFFRSNSS